MGPGALRAQSPQGYVINSVKKHLKEQYGIIFEDNMVLRTKPKDVKPVVSKEPKSLKDIFEGGF